MKEKFRSYYPGSEQNVENLLNHALIIFDSDSLLLLLRINKIYALRILNQFANEQSLKERFWLPYDVALMYHTKMNDTILHEIEKINSAKMNLTRLRQGISNYYHYPYLNNALVTDLTASFNKLWEELETQQAQLEQFICSSEVKDLINELFDEKVGESYHDGELKTIYEEGEKLGKIDWPLKRNSIGCTPIEQFHDLVVWKEIEKHVIANPQDVLFVTGFIRHEWHYIVNGKSISPRQELSNEFSGKTNGKQFYCIGFWEFIRKCYPRFFGTSPKWLGNYNDLIIDPNVHKENNDSDNIV